MFYFLYFHWIHPFLMRLQRKENLLAIPFASLGYIIAYDFTFVMIYTKIYYVIYASKNRHV